MTHKKMFRCVIAVLMFSLRGLMLLGSSGRSNKVHVQTSFRIYHRSLRTTWHHPPYSVKNIIVNSQRR